MAKLVVLYKTPADPTAFDRYYVDTHVPLARKIPGVLRYEVSTEPPVGPGGASPYHLVAVLEFESMAAIQAGLASAEGAAAAGDLGNFAQAGVELLMFDAKEV